MSTIPITEVVNVTPGVLPAGGSAVDIIGLVLTTSTRPPIGSVQTFTSQAAVATYFGATSAEAQNAAVYFNGYDNSTKKPGSIQFAQYPTAAVAAYLRGGNISALTLTQLQAISGALSITIDSVVKSGSPNLSGATSFSNAGSIIGKALAIAGVSQATFTGAIAGTTLTVSGFTAVNGGALGVGSVIAGGTTTAGTYITALGTGTGGNGTYTVDTSQTVSSASMTANAGAVAFDSVSGGFVVSSGTTGASSTIGYATGTAAASLKLTSATGAILSQGAIAATPSAFMTTLVQSNRVFKTFMLNFNPDQSGNANRLAFAAWNSLQGGKYAFAAIDDDAAPTVTVPATTSLQQLITAANYAGTAVTWQQASLAATINYGDKAAFVMGTAASFDYDATNGRTTFKFRSQAGLVPDVTDQTTFDNLTANGYNVYGAYAEGDESWQWYANGTVSGDFDWLDSYINQIWQNSRFRSDLVNLLKNTGAIPYNAAGRALIEAGLADSINAGLNFGVFRAGVTLSETQIAYVNARAGGTDIASTLSNQGWYLLIQDASPAVRQARGTPPMTFFYVDGEAVQALSLASIALQ